jgi:topoisomerase-4 subunit B
MASSRDLFGNLAQDMTDKTTSRSKKPDASDAYTAADIEVLEGLEPVRRRPGMYIGGTDEKAMHHLFAEVIDNAMDEAVAGHASWIEVKLTADGFLAVVDNGRGMPIDMHPKFPKKSALEVIMCTLHAGGKFEGKAYNTSGGLHGVGVSVVNALSETCEVEVARGQQLYRMVFSRGLPQTKLEKLGSIMNRRGTTVRFKPDEQIFGKGCAFKPAIVHRMARSKAYLFGGVEIRWSCAPELITDDTPAEAVFHFPGGLKDYLTREKIDGRTLVTKDIFSGRVDKNGGHGSVEWAVCWVSDADGEALSYCNTIPTPEGGTHETGLRNALMKGLRAYGELTNNKKAGQILAEDVMSTAIGMLSVFIREPEFQGQTKNRLSTVEATRIVETTVRDAFDHWLADSPQQATRLLEWAIEQAEDRQRRRKEKEVSRQSATRKLRLPGKLTDCSSTSGDTEIFLVEGDSAGGSAKQARDPKTQAILPLRGKILNVASATSAKLSQNQLLSDLVQALGTGTGTKYRDEELRYDRVIIMTDADVDGAHIASLLMTFFYQEMRPLVRNGHLYLAVAPFYKLTHGSKTLYAIDDRHREDLLKTQFPANAKVTIGRFKGLGEMNPSELKATTMDPKVRTLLRVEIADDELEAVSDTVNTLMGTKPELRFRFIQDRAAFATDLDV